MWWATVTVTTVGHGDVVLDNRGGRQYERDREGEQGTAATREQNLDPSGYIKVHEQGTADTRVAGYPRASTVHEGGGNDDVEETFSTINASTIVLNVLGGPGIFNIVSPGGNVEFSVYVGVNSTVTIPLNASAGYLAGGSSTWTLTFPQPIPADSLHVQCFESAVACKATVSVAGRP